MTHQPLLCWLLARLLCGGIGGAVGSSAYPYLLIITYYLLAISEYLVEVRCVGHSQYGNGMQPAAGSIIISREVMAGTAVVQCMQQQSGR